VSSTPHTGYTPSFGEGALLKSATSGDILHAINGGTSRTALGYFRVADARLFNERSLSTTRVVFSTTEPVDYRLRGRRPRDIRY
jgi:hypothetical protein